MLRAKDITHAHKVLKDVVVNTPLDYDHYLSEKYQAKIYLKKENMQRVRSFKLRGAYYAISQLNEEERQRGVVCASAGNHAQGVAYTCKEMKIPATIFMPITTPQQKISQVRFFGGEFVDIKLVGDTFDASAKAALDYTKAENRTFIAYENEMLQMLGVWQQGDFSGVLLGRYELLWATGILALFAYLIADQLTILGLGETVSVNLGLNRTAILWSGLIIVALITSLVVVTVGNIPFIGLVVPNIISRLMGDKLRQSLPAVALLGASLVLLCDIVGRVIVFPFEIPVSTVFGVMGTALFLWLLLRKPAHAV